MLHSRTACAAAFLLAPRRRWWRPLTLVPLLALALAAPATRAQSLQYDAATRRFTGTLPKTVRAGDTVRVTIVNPNTFREQYRIKYTKTDFHTASVPTALKPFFASSKATETSGFDKMPELDTKLFAALAPPDTDPLFQNMKMVEGKALGPRMKALYQRLRAGYQFQLELAAHARYYALIQHMDRDILEIVATRPTNTDIRYEVIQFLWHYYATMAQADPTLHNGDVLKRVSGSRVKGELPVSQLKLLYANFLNAQDFQAMTTVFPGAPARPAPRRNQYRREITGDFTGAQIAAMRRLAANVGKPISNALYFVKVADREVHLAENEMVRLWSAAVATNPVNPKEREQFTTFHTNYIQPIKKANTELSTAYMAYLDQLAPGFTAAAALCERVMDTAYTPGVIEDRGGVGSSADVFEVTIQQTPDSANLKALVELAADAPPAAGGPTVPATPPAGGAGNDGSRPVPEATFTSRARFDVQGRKVFDFSAGLIASGLQDEDQNDRRSRATVALTAFGHYYITGAPGFTRALGADALALTLGAPISQNTELDRFLVGASLVYGRENRIILSFGQEFGRVNRRVKAGTTGENATDPTYGKVWDNDWFAGLSFALNL